MFNVAGPKYTKLKPKSGAELPGKIQFVREKDQGNFIVFL